MLNETRTIRREVKLTCTGNKFLEELIQESAANNFSDYACSRLLGTFIGIQLCRRDFN